MKMFLGQICCSSNDDEFNVELLAAETQEEAEQKLRDIYHEFKDYYRWSIAREVKTVEGWKVTLSQ